ncbi:uncharacterized protein ARMOST_16107 [Armillaria ostoyae]|uniref:Uncharacterized protein n=1 Tax=Armillaria ostoyae TaxID=47428 RepID=A0A284RV86_ARMOS|nr:uncharacterized protein ARMOST_16107 [Armillaria ostoyae]
MVCGAFGLCIRYPTFVTVPLTTTGDICYAVAEGDACIPSVPVRFSMSSFEIFVNLFGVTVCSDTTASQYSSQTSWDLVIDLYYTDSYGLAVSIILEPHEWVQVEYFCGGQSMVIIDLADSATSSPSLIVLNYEKVEGWERTLHTNKLGSGLLAIRMIRKPLETARKHSVVPRLVTVASDMHYWMTIKKDVIAGRAASPSCQTKAIAQRSRVMNHGYFDSKLLRVLFARSL